MKITRKFLIENMTEKGGWTKHQLEVLGVEWPPVKGWMGRINGKEITKTQVEAFKLKLDYKDKKRIKREYERPSLF